MWKEDKEDIIDKDRKKGKGGPDGKKRGSQICERWRDTGRARRSSSFGGKGIVSRFTEELDREKGKLVKGHNSA